MENEEGNTEHVISEEKPEVEETKVASDVFNFLQNVKLEAYYESLVENGADKMNQLIYVDDTIIDQLCQSVNMKVIHMGVFKKAIRECRASAKLQNSANKNISQSYSPERDKLVIPYTRYEQPPSTNTPHPQLQPVEHPSALFDVRRRHSFNTENSHCYSSPQSHLAQLVAMAPNPHDNNHFYNRLTTPHINPVTESIHPAARFIVSTDDAHGPSMVTLTTRADTERKMPFAHEPSVHFTGKQSFVEGFTHHIMHDGCYYVTIAERSVKFPPSVRLLTHLDRIDSERREVIRKGSQIFGRDDTKRKSAELAPLEILMNEIAYEVCLRDFTYMISRQKLLGLVREIVKDNQIQLSTHHASYIPPVISTSNTNRENGRSNIQKPKVNSFYDNNVETVAVDPDDNKISSDYDVILYHKVNREWPPGISKERRKYLGRRSSNFEAINGVLFYSKENRRRQWLFEEEDIKSCFFRHHIDPITGEHLTKEFSMERMISQYYCKNMNETITRLYLSCDVCRSKFYSLSTPSHYGTRSNAKPIISINDERENSASYASYQTDQPPADYIQQNDSNESSMSSVKRKMSTLNIPSENPPVKKSRKSIPHKFVPPEQQIEESNGNEISESIVENEAEIPSTDLQTYANDSVSVNDDSNGNDVENSPVKNMVDEISVSETNIE